MKYPNAYCDSDPKKTLKFKVDQSVKGWRRG